MRLTLKIWRQENSRAKGGMVDYELDDVSEDMSFLEMLDVLNEKLNAADEEPIAFDHDCREGICGIVRPDDQRSGTRPRGHHDLPAAHALLQGRRHHHHRAVAR